MSIENLFQQIPANISGLRCEVLVVGGGGGGGDYHNTAFLTGGAGAGGLANATITLPIGSNAVVVGNGGVGNGDTSQLGENGGQSSIGPVIALGGAGAQGHGNTAAQTYAERSRFGGCGAGASARQDSSTSEGLPGLGLQGNDGVNHLTSGGGGGQGEAGKVAGASNDGGDGGDGTSAYDTWLQVTSQGVDSGGVRYIGGGGGGSGYTGGTSGSGGLGGGADGALSGTGANATANTGGGAGGSGLGSSVGAAGGKGIVIIRYKFQ